MKNLTLKEIANQFQTRGIQISELLLEEAQNLFLQYECLDQASDNTQVARLALLRFQNPEWTDEQALSEALSIARNNQVKSKGYGDDIINNLVQQNMNVLVDSGSLDQAIDQLFAECNQYIQNGLAERLLNNDSKRFNALKLAAERAKINRERKEDLILDVEYSESVDDVIASLMPVEQPKLLSSGDMFQSAERNNGGKVQKKQETASNGVGGKN